MDTIVPIERLRINLLELKPRKDLEDVYLFYKKSMNKYFDENGNPYEDYFEDVGCPICNSNKYNNKLMIDYFEYRGCEKCDSIYNSPRLKNEVLDRMYKSGEYETYFSKLTVSGQDLRKNVIDVRKFRQISSFFNSCGTILDVGCGTGSFLKVCQENGWEVYGVDPADSAVQIAGEKYDIEIENDYFESYETDKKFDCITFWGLLEHLSSPLQALAKAVKLLKSGGVISFEVPSSDCFLMSYLSNNHFVPFRYIESGRHISFFSRKSIDLLCDTFKLKLSYIESNGLDIQTILFNEFDDEVVTKIMAMQQTIDELMLGDHYRVFLKKST